MSDLGQGIICRTTKIIAFILLRHMSKTYLSRLLYPFSLHCTAGRARWACRKFWGITRTVDLFGRHNHTWSVYKLMVIEHRLMASYRLDVPKYLMTTPFSNPLAN